MFPSQNSETPKYVVFDPQKGGEGVPRPFPRQSGFQVAGLYGDLHQKHIGGCCYETKQVCCKDLSQSFNLLW